MNWQVVSDAGIAGLLLIGALWPIVTRKPMRYSIPFRGVYDAKPALQLVLQVLYVGIATYAVVDMVLRLKGSR